MSKKILVIGATGFVGAPIVRQLLADGFSVRALVRDADKARKMLGERVELVVGSFEDQAALEKALAGCEGVNLSAPWPAELRLVQNVTAVLARQGRREVRLSYISGATVRPENRGYAMIDQKLQAEEALRQSGQAYTILKPSWFMDALALFVRDGRATLFGRQSQPYYFLAVADFARAVSQAHQSEAAANRSFVLNGPQALPMAEALQRYCDAAHPGLKASNLPIWFGRILAALTNSPSLKDAVQMLAYFEKSPAVSAPDGAEHLLGAPALTLDAWLKTQTKG